MVSRVESRPSRPRTKLPSTRSGRMWVCGVMSTTILVNGRRSRRRDAKACDSGFLTVQGRIPRLGPEQTWTRPGSNVTCGRMVACRTGPEEIQASAPLGLGKPPSRRRSGQRRAAAAAAAAPRRRSSCRERRQRSSDEDSTDPDTAISPTIASLPEDTRATVEGHHGGAAACGRVSDWDELLRYARGTATSRPPRIRRVEVRFSRRRGECGQG